MALSTTSLPEVLQKHRFQQLAISSPDVLLMMAELRHSSRQQVLSDALSAWFAYATGLPVLEVETTEQTGHLESDLGKHLVFRVRLKANYEEVVQKCSHQAFKEL